MAEARLTMLGTTNAGKTCFMVGMYAVMRMAVKGFTFSCVNSDHDLDLADKWDRLVGSTGQERWPLPSEEPVDYTFNFNYAFKRIMTFDWLDYRGGAMSDKSTAGDVEGLVKAMLDSSCLLLCVSGEHLADGNPGRNAVVQSKARIGSMNQHLQKVRERAEASGRQLPGVVLVITKYDRCAHRPHEEVVQQVKELFSPLFAPDSGWLVAVCPVTLGAGLADVRTMNDAEIEPRNIHFPVTFAIYCVLKQNSEALKAVIDSQKKQARDLGGNPFKNLFNKKAITRMIGEARLKEQDLERVFQNMALLVNEIADMPVFFSGEEVELG